MERTWNYGLNLYDANEKKAINIGAMNVKYNFHALDFSLSPRMMLK